VEERGELQTRTSPGTSLLPPLPPAPSLETGANNTRHLESLSVASISVPSENGFLYTARRCCWQRAGLRAKDYACAWSCESDLMCIPTRYEAGLDICGWNHRSTYRSIAARVRKSG
jgi:hypothetical protein